jgi:BolA family transcriptional regulator, general stress-responsive regulator
MNTQERLNLIQTQLQQALSPTRLEIFDESHHHLGHPGAASGAGHFKLIVSSPLFTHLNRIACHRLIYQALDKLIPQEIHALSIEII